LFLSSHLDEYTLNLIALLLVLGILADLAIELVVVEAVVVVVVVVAVVVVVSSSSSSSNLLCLTFVEKLLFNP